MWEDSQSQLAGFAGVQSMGQRRWARDELLVTFSLYCRTPFGRLHRLNPDVLRLAHSLRRTPDAVAMKLCNFAGLDPAQQARNIRGLANASAADRAIFDEFNSDWEGLAYESELAVERIGMPSSQAPVDNADPSTGYVGVTEAERSVRVRTAQAFFRRTVMVSYSFTCAVCEITVPCLLQASHIIPWSMDESRRADPRNGIALCALHDRMFDRGLMTFDEQLHVLLSGQLRTDDPCRMHIVAINEIEGAALHLPHRFLPDTEALRFHRYHIFLPG